MQAPTFFTYVTSPVGDLLVSGTEKALTGISFPRGSKAYPPKPDWVRNDAPFGEVRRQLNAYFAGDLKAFQLSLEVEGTEFQRRVWWALADIPFGETRSYGWQAKVVGTPSAARAVGAANGANPIPIILPCHRVIGSNGALTGFGGGIEVKRWLLAHEGALPAEEGQLALF
jgi:methylated-DNA-[protein]-cysteine S-methyltransferase